MTATVQNNEVVLDNIKDEISEKVSTAMSDRNLKIREIGRMTNVKHPQVVRITEKENYTVDTVLKVLHGLGYTLRVVEK